MTKTDSKKGSEKIPPYLRETFEIKLVSEKEMYERNPFLKMHLIDNPFYDFHNENPRVARFRMLRRGVTKNMALDLLKPLYTTEAVELIGKLLDKGKTEFIMESKEGRSTLYAK